MSSRYPTERSSVERYLPVGYFALSAVLVVALLPTALRPPRDDPTTSAEFAPDAPAEENPQSILGDLGRGRTGTAGSGRGSGDGSVAEGPAPPPDAPPPPEVPRGCPHGFGDPPRQTESLYAAPCAPAWEGDNGGATYKNITRDEVRVAWATTSGGQQASYEGPVPFEAQEGESAADRTLRVFQQYFNETFQSWGRTFRIVSVTPDAGEDSQRAAAVRADEEYRVFATHGPAQFFCDEIARRRLISWCGQKPAGWFLEGRPRRWSWWMDMTKAVRFGAEYACKKLVGRRAKFAGDPTYQDQERRLGLFFLSDASNRSGGEDFARFLRDGCGAEVVEEVGVSLSDADTHANYASAVTQFRAEQVTTVVLVVDFVSSAVLSNAADGQKYYPEWFIPGVGAIDRNQTAQLHNQTAWRNAFGLSPTQMELPLEEMDCYRAYKWVDPTTEPHFGVCNVAFPGLLQIANGIQMAGPDLTPEAFEMGLFQMGRRSYGDVRFAVGGGYGAGDYTYMDDVVEIWWDPSTRDPQCAGSRTCQGAYRYVRCGERYGLDELPREESRVFDDGIIATEPCPGAEE